VAEEFDVVCLGAGPAGEALTGELAGSGLTLAVVERDLVGGECAYFGCMPTKTMLRAAETVAEAHRARELAASRVDYDVDFSKVHKRTAWMARDWNDSGAAKAVEDKGARLFRGEGRLTGPRTVDVDGTTLTARRAVVIATGTSPAAPRMEGLDTVKPWTNRDAVKVADLPKSLTVVGGGAVGVELAQAFARLGTGVHILESGAHVLALEEDEAGRFLQQRLVAEGIEVTDSCRVQRAEPDPDGIKVSMASGLQVTSEHLLVATGRKPNLDGFDLVAAGVATDQRGFVQVDRETLLAGDGIYAVGDVNGIGGFTHLAHYHGTWVGKMLRGEPVRLNHSAIPRVIFTDPEVAAVGMSEKEARAAGIDVRVATADVGNSSRGYIHGEPGGVVKLVADGARQVLVGATICSPRAGEMISEITLAVRAEVPLSLLRDLVHPFPTFSRILQGMLAELR
jgi:pyruvate/2-oxoglutarate dehydrogenase complex dihydrolipoamide dehydrogenase (E3) component